LSFLGVLCAFAVSQWHRLDTLLNEYCSFGGTSVTHDANGNLTNDVRF